MKFNGHEWQGNDGFYNGFTAVTMYDLSRQLTITASTNDTDNADPAYRIWHGITKVFDTL